MIVLPPGLIVIVPEALGAPLAVKLKFPKLAMVTLDGEVPAYGPDIVG